MNLLFSESSIEIYKSIIQYNPDAIFILSVDGIMMEVNQAVSKLSGYTEKELIGKLYEEMVMPENLEETKRYFSKVLQGETCEYETKAIQKNGDVIFLQVKNVPLLVNDEIAGVFTVAKDMTELYKMKYSLQQMEGKFKSLFNSAGDAIDITDLDGNIIDVNPAFEELYGWKREEIIGKPLPVIPSNNRLRFQSKVDRTKQLGKYYKDMEVTCVKKDGSYIDVSLTFSPIRDMHGSIIGTSGITRDITEKKQLELSLKESEERYRLLVESSPEPIIVYQKGKILYANLACIKLLGVSSLEELINKSIMNYVHPDFAQITEERFQQIKEVGIVQETTEKKLIRKNGTSVDVEATGISIRHYGKPAFLMMYHDLTKRKQTEQALLQSEEKYRLIAENMTDLVCILDQEGYFKYASPSHETVLGFPSEAYVGKKGREWMHTDDFLKVRKILDEMIKTKEAGVFEYRFRDVTKNWLWLEAKVTPIFEKDGRFKHFLLVSREISERKMYEEQLAHMAYHDTLTGIANRRVINHQLERALSNAKSQGHKIAVLYLDLDHFKKINDSLGHDVGDELLKQFTNKVQNCLSKDDVFARQGGDEFIILLTKIKEEQEAVNIAKSILTTFQEPWKVREYTFQTTSSIGISCFPDDGVTGHKLLQHADFALYEAKRAGRNNVKTYRSMKRST
ncbi:PAS domain S-box protein [Bacillus ginsengihumi]|uniref:PAS domain S-box protein n=1 Tax=Heyndrickxia ginsengihumi TaxID=363870 RepID=A0A6M0P5P3_9BACI|nr:PAS domain S-box protein [Heyndrickxia ginsengihumi]MBE6184429.1 PAS domain S-box protein [Bacillus sp. (in: firmicutes)]NEY19783.1 PAS domain S-box protein [Heyndrickxia ginsengihumi]